MDSELIDCLCDILPDDVIHNSLQNVMTVTHEHDNGASNVQMGTILTPTQVLKEPKISFPTEPNTFYSLLMTDPDAVSREKPLFREFLHWGVVNISDVKDGNILAGEKASVVGTYVPAGAPHNSGLHRYIYLLYKQIGLLSAEQIETFKAPFEARGGQKAHELATNLGMTLMAANAYKAEWDASVDAIHESLAFMPPEEYQSPLQKEKAKK